jgi:hypothetical protein
MPKFMRWEDDDTFNHNRLRMRDDGMPPDDVVGLEDVVGLDKIICR